MTFLKLASLTICAALALFPAPVRAQSTLGDLVQAEVLDGGLTPRGTYMAALRLTLSDGWKTYWRAPGDAGIPPQFDWGASHNLGNAQITWPTPHVFDQGGVQTIGYKNQLVLPVEITPRDPGKAVHLRATMDFGMCKDVCVPGSLTVDHALDAGAKRHPAIAAAIAQRPFDRSEAGVTSATCQLSPIKGGLRIKARIAMPSAGGNEVAVIESGNPQIWSSPAETQRNGNVLLAQSDLVHVSDGTIALDRSAVRITVLGRRHAVDIQGCAPG